MNDSFLYIYVTDDCPFCKTFLSTEAPLLLTYLIHKRISYNVIEASREQLKDMKITSVPCIDYNGMIITPKIRKFVFENLIDFIEESNIPSFSSISKT